MKAARHLVSIAILFLSASLAAAQAPSLYGASVEESAVVVRVVNASSAPISFRVGAQTLSAQAFGQASAYKPIAADIYTLSHAGKRWEFLPESSSYYTLVALDDRLLIFKDVRHGDPAKAQLYFYNLCARGGVELKTADGKTRILGPLDAMASAQAAVNALGFKAAAYAGQLLGAACELSLKRGESWAFFVADTAAGPKAFTVQASVARD